MSYALIDNASLTAVQRVMGQITVQNPDTINGDLVALENFLHAILFYDKLICIDNYKPEHVQTRKNIFNFIEFLSPKDFDLKALETKTISEAKNVRPEIRGGEFVDNDFREFLNLLKMNMICTWDLRSSVYYLTMKMLGEPNTQEFQKYSEISSAIFNELSDVNETRGRWNKDITLIGSDGHIHSQEEMRRAAIEKNRGFGGTTRALDMFIASLNWISYKSIYYSLAAKHFKADTFLHPIRHAYQIHWMRKTGAYGHDFTAKLVESLSKNLSTSISEVIDNGRTAAISIELPIFSAWLTAQTGNVSQIIQSARDLRDTHDFQEIRELLRKIRISYDESGIARANKSIEKWKKEIDKAAKNLKRQYGINTDQGIQGSFLIKVYNSIAAVKSLPQFPEFNFKIPLPEFIQANNSSCFSNLYKNITGELTAVERLGSLRDMMASKFRIDSTCYLAPKTESPRFRNYASDWKLPM
ncbi:hypothetical protein JW897_07460 [Chromobacterium alkanivorans]|uniref:hypothetical protein n=1 Tax=Chromobacterium alkanivorans TaxID=1071719 RepID=UPI0019673AEB|nr:hypothetical protein [Chromobacterium alkanivorans]MBN3003574.1 hypothetical protein [Chromobacterium alkanivorans]